MEARDIRNSFGFTQKDFSKMAGMSRSALAMWESGARNLPEDAAFRLEVLVDLIKKHGDDIGKSGDSISAALRRKLAKRAVANRVRAGVLQARLDRMVLLHANLLKLGPVLLQLLKKKRQDKSVHSWAARQQRALPGRIKRYNADARMIIRLHIANLLSQASAIENMLKES